MDDYFEFNSLIPEQERVANSLVGKVVALDGRDVEIFGAYGTGADMFFLLKWLDTGNFFSQDFYTTVTTFSVE